MAITVVGIAEKIVAYLVPQAIETVGKLWGIKQELKALGDTISTIQAVLDDAEKQYYQSRQIQGWLEKLKDAFYDAQDVLEEVNIEALRRELRGHSEISKEVRTFFSSSNQLAFKLKMSYKVRAVREKIEAIKADRKFHLDERSVDSLVERQWRKREETHSFVSEGDIKGRDDDKTIVRKFLLDSNVKENVSILPIVGIGGLGKTALAQFIYNDEMVSKHFHLKMWVCVSNDFDEKRIVANIIACAKKKGHSEDAMEQLQSELRAEIDGKRYLLVLDDLWNEEPEKWLSLKKLLVGGARGSKILITTRLPSVAKITGTAPPHLLGGLSESVSLDLLMQMAYRKEEEIQDPEMVAIAKEIVRKCFGVPLVVRTVGSLLFFKKTKLEWLTFKDYELPDVSQREDNIISVLRLSYDYLPSHLKQCFTFCSLFPKDYEIQKQTLVNLWVAEGFIQPSNRSQHLEDIAHGYFMDLLWSNFFQDFQEDKETCKMHDLMHDLACLVAGTECRVAWDRTKSIHERTRHVSYGSTFNLTGEFLISCSKASALRTFLCAASDREMESMSEADLRQLIQSFKRLRVLDLHTTYVEKVPRSIYKLKYLTYLDLSGNVNLKRLPNSITRLQNLQTLNLNSCFSLEELPRGIRKLVSLRNLYIDYCWKLGYVPCGLGQLRSLHRLTRFILPKDKALAKDCCELGELKELNNIRESLRIENLGSVMDAVAESKAANLIGKHSLESLELKWGDFNTNDSVIGNRDETLLDGLRPHSNLQKLRIEGYEGESFPRWMMDSLVFFLPKLVEVRFNGCGRCKRLPPLGLDKLKSLLIEDMESLECVPGECWKSLTSLKYLSIWNCPGLTSLSKWLLQASNLEDLHIWGCEELDLSKDESGGNNNLILDFHGGLHHSLRSLWINGLPKLAYLPQWLLQASNLERLKIENCSNLKALPEQIEALQSLQRLEIGTCPLLTSLPEGIRRLSSLTHLTIYNCPELERRCKRDAGEDWDKIAHIPRIDFEI
ncbi:putative disease resistance protein RGA4 [Syzygium oleosum]|uniref:putative disease resistance protein RGA4 n=1 Tax=Syzygium oleosum TaxID=219896 RepID=UPI0024BAF3A2|nr:putative disease resistance protein RGA4 [Syzygium oleosum]